MSAIAGLFFRDGRPPDPACLDRMASRLSHRGPHGSSAWAGESAGFASRELRTASGSAVPVSIHRHDSDAIVVIADARIDNRAELAAGLGLGPDRSDASLIAAAYRAYGSRAPERLIGDFAFALWDGERRTLLCARDPFGARPLCYHLSPRVFVFASEIKSLFALPEVPRELDEVQVAFYLDGFFDDPERTFFRDIRRLPAAHVLEVTADSVRMERYWALDPAREIRYADERQYAEEFRALFLEAVRARVLDADPVAAAVSGGLDSSSVALAARLVLPEDRAVHAFSAVFPGLPAEEREYNDESAYIAAVTEGSGLVAHRIRVDDVPPLTDYDRVLTQMDSPPLAFNLYMHWALFSAAAREGIRVFLDGTDGDSVVSKGFERFVDLANEGRWGTAVEEVRALTAREGAPRGWYPGHLLYPQLLRLAQSGRWRDWFRATGVVASGLGRSRPRLRWKYGFRDRIPRALRRGLRPETWRNGAEPGFMRHELAARVGLAERKRALESGGWACTAREDHVRVLSLPRYQFALELIDGVAAGFGIVPRFPYFDRRLVEFCVAIPPDQKLADGWTRLIQRRAMEGILPPAVQWRIGKGMLGFSFARGMHAVEAPRLANTLFDDPTLLEDFVDMDVLQATYDRFLASEPSSEHSNEDAMKVYTAAVLAMWLRDHGPAR